MLKYIALSFLFLCVPTHEVFAQPQALSPLPAALEESIAKRYTHARILTYSQPCNALPDGVEQIAILVGTKAHTSLQAMVAVNDGNTWKITEVAKSVEYPRGSDSDFLRDFEGSNLIPEIRCATPNQDPDISLDANGLYILKHRHIRHKQAKHLCFATSTAYNSWVCYWTPPKTTVAKVSFVQMNAD